VVNRIHLLIFWLAMLLLHACASIYSVVEFEVLQPATVSIPENVQQLLILNRAPISMDVFEERDIKGVDHKQLIMLDTFIVNNLERGLLEVLQGSPIDRFRTPFWLTDRRLDTSAMDDLILTRREVDAICTEWGGDAIICLESYSMDYDEHIQNYSDSDYPQTAYYEISSIIKWNIYLPGSPRPFDSYTMVDTLFFTEVQDGLLIRRYHTSEMLKEAFFVSGKKYGRYLVPVWNHASRILFKGDEKALREASKLTSQGDWDKAYIVWEEMSESVDSTASAKALYNMAIFHELEDHLDSANLLVNEALKRDTLELIRAYKEEIDTRILNRKELYKQVR